MAHWDLEETEDLSDDSDSDSQKTEIVGTSNGGNSSTVDHQLQDSATTLVKDASTSSVASEFALTEEEIQSLIKEADDQVISINHLRPSPSSANPRANTTTLPPTLDLDILPSADELEAAYRHAKASADAAPLSTTLAVTARVALQQWINAPVRTDTSIVAKTTLTTASSAQPSPELNLPRRACKRSSPSTDPNSFLSNYSLSASPVRSTNFTDHTGQTHTLHSKRAKPLPSPGITSRLAAIESRFDDAFATRLDAQTELRSSLRQAFKRVESLEFLQVSRDRDNRKLRAANLSLAARLTSLEAQLR